MITVAIALNVGFRRFCPKICLSEYDNIRNVTGPDGGARKQTWVVIVKSDGRAFYRV